MDTCAMKQAFRRASALCLVSAFVLALASATVSARSYGYGHHHYGHYLFSYGGTSRAGLVRALGN
jgi:hypothetical protein